MCPSIGCYVASLDSSQHKSNESSDRYHEHLQPLIHTVSQCQPHASCCNLAASDGVCPCFCSGGQAIPSSLFNLIEPISNISSRAILSRRPMCCGHALSVSSSVYSLRVGIHLCLVHRRLGMTSPIDIMGANKRSYIFFWPSCVDHYSCST